LNNLSSTKKHEESQCSFSTESEKENEDTVDDTEFDRHRGFLIPSMNPHYSIVSSKKSFTVQDDVINEDEEDDGHPLDSTPKLNELKNIKKNFTVVKSRDHLSNIERAKKTITNFSGLINLK